MTAVDVIVVSFNTRDDLARCLTSVIAGPGRRALNVTVVDNGSSDDSVAMVRDQFPAVRVIALGHNAGFAAANNAGIRATSAPLVLLLNSDTIVPAGAIDTLCDRLEATGAAAAGPRLVDGRGRPEISWGPMLSPLAEWRQARRVAAAASDAEKDRRLTEGWTSTERTVDWVSGACLLVRRDAAVRAGLLDERYFMYEEDVDFCAALRAQGGRVLFTPATHVVHLRGRSMATLGVQRPAFYDASHVAFYEKHLPQWAWALRVWKKFRT